MRYSLYLSQLFIFLIMSCSIEQKPIEYGSDKCEYCDMTIVDKKFGAEIVNNKGKAFKFDAAECLIRYIIQGEIANEDISLLLVTAVNKPENLIDATKGHYLISENLPSPMGAFLTSYENENDAKEFHSKYGGKLYSWNNLLKSFTNKN